MLFVVSIRAQEDLEPNFSAPFYALVKDLLHYTPELSDFDQSELIPSVPSKFLSVTIFSSDSGIGDRGVGDLKLVTEIRCW